MKLKITIREDLPKSLLDIPRLGIKQNVTYYIIII